MNTPSPDHDLHAQQQAERAERDGVAAGDDPRIDRYRLIVRALRRPPAQGLPADFAAQVARRAQQGQGRGFEDWLTIGLLLAMGVVAVPFIVSALGLAAQGLAASAPSGLPGHELLIAAISIGIVWATDRGWERRHLRTRLQ